ncbi:hypothetical protein NBRC10512_004879 [Rhodotorula toruloides]|uniref:RHTO0S01e11804g1_1 n=2 Tax=Rhodotorula toruloides TaxID=5286 RepID=A0A061AL21_RHOTO|nr:uncharacterized protein RHTO_04732 [Rhodotorula toruloides NP11]EMS24553.1 hypothetical protein RHTO_04732 [Rhodotorula toruloides NP11]CDR35995.1 RHTO0S01e11804g1_1 [Rhodotorula toruloides]
MNTAVPLPETLSKAVQRALPRWNRRRCATLAGELSTLWWGLRTAVLLDTCSLSEDEAAALGWALQALQKNLSVAHEPVSGQTLVLNRDLLAERVVEDVTFIDVGGREAVLVRPARPYTVRRGLEIALQLDGPPPSFRSLLTSVAAHRSSSPFLSLTLPSPGHPTDLIPFVGFLIDYPVAYCLSHEGDGRNCLGGEELVVTEAELVGPGEMRQRLLAFSYPIRLAPSIPPQAIAEALENKLRARLAKAATTHPELQGCRVEVGQRNVTLDQVAL